MADIGERVAKVETRQEETQTAQDRINDGHDKRLEALEQKFWWLATAAMGGLGTLVFSLFQKVAH